MTSSSFNASQVEEIIADQLRGQVPGAALAILRSGRPVFAMCDGVADLECGRPVTPATVFQLASLSKPFTALAVMSLERDGLLELDAPVRRYLPDYPAHADQVLIRHLLTHTSGIPNFVTQPSFQRGASRLDHTDEELMERFATQPLHFSPGTRLACCNSGYRLLDIIVARVTGAPFAQVLAERVLTPAGMHDTRLLSDAEIVPGRARGYVQGPHGYANAPYLNMTIPGGAGGIGSTLRDLLRFDRALRAGLLADDALQRRLFTPTRLANGRTEGYGLGWMFSNYRGSPIIYHAGGISGFSCLYLRIPAEDTSIVMLTNLGGYPCAATGRRLIDAVVPMPRPRRRPVGLPRSSLDDRTGSYTDTINLIEIAAGQGHLVVSQADQVHRMLPIDSATYIAEDDPDIVLRFHDDEPHSPCTLSYPLSWITGYRTGSPARIATAG